MKSVWYGEGDLAWFEPENDEDKQVLAKLNAGEIREAEVMALCQKS